MNEKINILIYGSYGYSGKLIVEQCIAQGLKPLLGGRNEATLMAQAKSFNLGYRTFDLNFPEQTRNALNDCLAVINCAGPFLHTFKPMVEACLAANTHYIDITGEYQVFEQLMTMNEQAKSAGVMLLPGAGFDVVPSDCLAHYLKTQLPDATDLVLAIAAIPNGTNAGPGISRGTARTMLEGYSSGTMTRDNGVLKQVPLSWKARYFNLGIEKKMLCSTVSWGDISSAWWSTGIPHIETYMALPPKMIKMNKFLNPFKWIVTIPPIKRYLERKINQLPEGPSPDARQHSIAKIYGEVKNKKGEVVKAIMTTPNGYALTALTAVAILNKVLTGNAPAGFQTPSTAYGMELVMDIPGVSLKLLN